MSPAQCGYIQMLELHWKRLSSAGFVNDFQPIYNNYGWADYITSAWPKKVFH